VKDEGCASKDGYREKHGHRDPCIEQFETEQPENADQQEKAQRNRRHGHARDEEAFLGYTFLHTNFSPPAATSQPYPPRMVFPIASATLI
jgi:hypothetical protein